MKNMSFGKLLAIFGGFFVVVIILAVVIIQATSSGKSNNRVVSSRTNSSANQQQYQSQQTDILTVQLQAEQERTQQLLAEKKDTEAKFMILQRSAEQTNQQLLQHINKLSNTILALEQRINQIEESRKKVYIIKPSKEASTAKVPENVHKLPDSQVQTTVAGLAWVKSNGRIINVTAGDIINIPTKAPVKKVQTKAKIRAIDSDGVYIRTSN